MEQIQKQVPKLTTVETLRPEIGQFIVQKYTEGIGYRKIADMVEKKFGYQLSHMAVSRYIKKKLAQIGQRISEDPALMEQTADVFLDTVEQMKMLNAKLWSLMNKLKESKSNIPEILNVAREIRYQVELQNKLLGKIHTGTQINIGRADNINTISVAMMVHQHLEKLQEKGYILIKKDLKRIDAIKDFERKVGNQNVVDTDY